MYKIYIKILCKWKDYIHKFLLIMKLTTILLVITFLHVKATTYGQQITFKKSNTTIEQLTKEIRKQTGYNVLLPSNRISTSTKINANFSGTSLQLVMDKLLEGSNLTYVIEENMIVVMPKDQASLNRASKALTNVSAEII